MKKLLFFIVFASVSTMVFQWSPDISLAQTDVEKQEELLRKELEKTEQEIQQTQGVLNVQKAKSQTIESEVNKLTGQIKQAQATINVKDSAIRNLGQDIALKDQTVQQLNDKMDRSKKSLAQLIKKTNELDDTSLAEVIIANENLSDFFITIDTYDSLKQSLETLFDEIRELRGLTEEEKIALEAKKNKELDVKAEIEAEKRKVAVKEAEQKSLLSVSKQVEGTYEQVLAEKQQKAASIRAALFRLRDSAGISFGEALKFAEAASKATGVRTAFILAILKQESDLGQNVGTCNRVGDPEDKLWYNIMPGPLDNSWRDDQTIFKRIVKQLGRPEVGTPLSCPIAGGWGGAMGPSQFIPATWQGYEGKIRAAVGAAPDPWNPEHAFTATGLYMQDLGAAAGGFTAERTAALKYYAGSNWNQPQNAFYGNSVIQHASNFQQQIDFLHELD